MKRIIKITEAQLREAEGDAFKYLDANDDAKPYNGQSTITAQGKIDGETNAEPIFTDRIAKQKTPQAWARYRMYGNINMRPHAESRPIDISVFNEGVSTTPTATYNDKEADVANNGIKDFDEHVAMMGNGNGLETLSDNNSNNNLCVIPQGVDRFTNMLINSINQHSLNPKQIAMVLDKIQEAFPQIQKNSESIKSVLRQQVDPNSIKDFDK